MENVVPLFRRSNINGTRSEQGRCNLAAKTSMAASNDKLARATAELSRQFDAMETAFETVDEAETRTRLKQSIKQSREALMKTMLKLSQQIEAVLVSA